MLRTILHYFFALAVVLAGCDSANESHRISPENINSSAQKVEGDLVSYTTALEPGDPCEFGGQTVTIGIERSGDKLLQDSEVQSRFAICNGENALILLSIASVEEPGENCKLGGSRVSMGLDKNRDDSLNNNEIQNSVFVCNSNPGADGSSFLVASVPEAPGANCVNGGHLLSSGQDLNSDSQLNSEEASHNFYICNGSDGMNAVELLNALTVLAPGDLCAQGGTRIEFGADNNKNNALDATEVSNSVNVCNSINGSNGLNTLVRYALEPAGDNCGSGGIVALAGLDANRDGSLGGDEVTTLEYVCHGQPGANGINFLANYSVEPQSTNCRYGGIKINHGLDFSTNGLLETEEISGTSYLCEELLVFSVSPNEIPTAGNTTVTVRGKNFRPGLSISTAKPCLSLEFVSSEELRCRPPEHAAGSVSFTITNPDGVSATSPRPLTYAADSDLFCGDGLVLPSAPLTGNTYGLNAVKVLPDGKILGIIEENYSGKGTRIARFLDSGVPDKTFGNGSGFVRVHSSSNRYDKASQIILLDDGGFIVAGDASTGSRNSQDILIMKFLANGTLDTAFSEDGILLQNFSGNDGFGGAAVHGLSLFIVGSTHIAVDQQALVAKFQLLSGEIDSTFGSAGFVSLNVNQETNSVYHDFATNVIPLSDGRLIVTGWTEISRHSPFATRLLATGGLDTSFGTVGFFREAAYGGSNSVVDAKLQRDGKIIIAGDFGSWPNQDVYVLRLTAEGVLDASFGSQGVTVTDFGADSAQAVFWLLLPDDQSILVGGSIAGSYNNNKQSPMVLKYTKDGSLDSSFGTQGFSILNSGFDYDYSTGFTADFFADGGILLAGSTNTHPIYMAFLASITPAGVHDIRCR